MLSSPRRECLAVPDPQQFEARLLNENLDF